MVAFFFLFKEIEKQSTAGRTELDLETLKVQPSLLASAAKLYI